MTINFEEAENEYLEISLAFLNVFSSFINNLMTILIYEFSNISYS